MTSHNHSGRAASLALLAAGVATAPAAGQVRYDFVNVADTTGPYLSFGIPVINDAGKVVFQAGRDAGGMGIFTGPNPVADAVATTDGPYSTLGVPAINAGGTVVFSASRDAGGSGIFTGPDPVANAVVTSDGPYSSFGNPAINDAGTVAFVANRDAGGGGIFTGPDPVANAVATTDGPYSSFSLPTINNAGTVAFQANRVAGGGGIFTGPDPVADAVATSDGPYQDFAEATINAGGTVAFFATLDAGGQGLFTGPDPVADAVVTAGGPFSGIGAFDLNDAGAVVFRGSLTAGGNGLFTGPDLDADRIVRSGEALFGSAVTGLNVRTGALDSFGDVGFVYVLSDGRSGIAVAVASYRYTAAAGGSFDDAANFAFGAAPAAAVPTLVTPANGLILTGPVANRTLRSLTLGTAGSGVAELRLRPSGQLTVNETLTVQAQGKLRVDGVASAQGGVANAGEIELVNDAQLNGGPLLNTGLLRGDGTVGNAVTNAGRIEAIGTAAAPAELAFTSAVNNRAGTGLIAARNAAVRFNGGLTNAGSLAVSFGTTDVFGDVANTGSVVVSGGAQATFYDDVVQNGTLRVSKVGSTTGAAVFLGGFSGSGGATGGGDLFFEGDLRPGNSPAVVTFDNAVFLGSGANTEIEIAGLATGEFDQFIINGDLALDGTLTVVPLDGFAFGPNQSFTIFDVSGALSGTFAGLGEGDRVGTFGGTDLFITYAGGTGNDVALFTSVPEPSTAGLLPLGAVGLLHRRRRATGSSAARATT